jgi:hypothetical protein
MPDTVGAVSPFPSGNPILRERHPVAIMAESPSHRVHKHFPDGHETIKLQALKGRFCGEQFNQELFAPIVKREGKSRRTRSN